MAYCGRLSAWLIDEINMLASIDNEANEEG
jgi:hypothetical protein